MDKRLQILGLAAMIGALSVGCGQQQRESPATPSAEVTSEVEGEAEKENADKETQVNELEEEAEASPEVTETSNSESSGVAVTPATTGKELIDAAFTSEDPHYDFKVKYTQDFLDKVDKMYSLLDERYKPEYDDECEFYVSGERSQLKFGRDVTDYNEKYKYIYEVKNYMGFEDAKDDLYGWQKLDLNLCDEDNDGKIELNDATSTILTTFYPDINLTEVQEKIDAAVEAEKAQDYEPIHIDPEEKYYGWIGFSWFRYQDNPVQVEITLDWYQNYPEN